MTSQDEFGYPIANQWRSGLRRGFVELSNGSLWTRRIPMAGKDSLEWIEVERPDSPVQAETCRLAVVAEKQAEGEPKHWSLFSWISESRKSESGAGKVWQVTGDNERMQYWAYEGVDLLRSNSYAWHQIVHKDLSPEQLDKVESIIQREPAPRAASRALVRENCQTWVLKIFARLVEEGIVEERMVGVLTPYLDRINPRR